ncbi:unnamed protein product [Sphenostylis stenocarpa]|uniref:RIN4 pathogenic type III effector avirulence factor Avr cleavage site domain-containing protein n=1 Tax=Sphenostylis stenocarpa TaxID=92480 RepID=A0AA86RXN4_9FABA|nr:unnamed protein product [Sphenostylis stenocarpa]
MASYDEQQGKPLPKFGEWDVNDPASAEGFTVIFNKARDEKKIASVSGRFPSQRRLDSRKRKNHKKIKSSSNSKQIVVKQISRGSKDYVDCIIYEEQNRTGKCKDRFNATV